MAVITPITLNQVQYSGETYRRAVAGLSAAGNAAGTVRTGVLDPRALAVTLSGTDVIVGPGPCMIDAGGKGGYLTGVDAPTSAGLLAAADPTNPRLDRVVLEVLDPDNGSAGTVRLGRLRIVPGTPGAIPGLPAAPPLSLTIGEVQVPVSGAPVFTDRRPFTAAAGAPLQVTKAERDALTPYRGQEIIRTDRDYWRQQYDGAGWKFVGEPVRYITPAASFTNLVDTVDRLIATAPVPTKNYAQRVSVYGRLTVHCPSIVSGVQAIDVAVSAVQTLVSAAQSAARLNWTAGFSNISQTAAAEVLDVLVPANAAAAARVWVGVVSGAVTTTVASPVGKFSSLYADVRPEND